MTRTVSAGASETTALTGSTEAQQFHGDKASTHAHCVWDNFMLTPDGVSGRVKDRVDEAAGKPKLQVVSGGVGGAA